MIEELQRLVNERKQEILNWLQRKQQGFDIPIYCSFDIRDNGVKAGVIDSNLFPGGFNNLDATAKARASLHFKEFISTTTSSKDVLIIPEAHTRNEHYLGNLCALKHILQRAGFTVTLGTVREDAEDTLSVKDNKGHTLILEKMYNVGGSLHTKSFMHGLILLNNDFSVPVPPLLENVTDEIRPPLRLGWTHRKKYNHFRYYCKLIDEFSSLVGIDPWLLCPETLQVDNVDFKERKNIDLVAAKVDLVISFLRKKYDQYGIAEKPFVFVKDNSGTYGMGIITAESGNDILELNTKGRQKMSFGKQKSKIDSVIIQEGISTKYKVGNGFAEPVLYAVGGNVVGGFMRIHDDRDGRSSLNAPGVKFDTILKPDITCPIMDCVKTDEDIGLYEVLARIAMLAIGKEMEA
ncbi:MAG TPA: glutamate--cysteine ligase [Candidatus Nanoarchaeia archaeon]|nr:glutamate--cysteine ligase [Candidatus Nanoarchaeia archaeon]